MNLSSKKAPLYLDIYVAPFQCLLEAQMLHIQKTPEPDNPSRMKHLTCRVVSIEVSFSFFSSPLSSRSPASSASSHSLSSSEVSSSFLDDIWLSFQSVQRTAHAFNSKSRVKQTPLWWWGEQPSTGMTNRDVLPSVVKILTAIPFRVLYVVDSASVDWKCVHWCHPCMTGYWRERWRQVQQLSKN